VRAVVLKKLEDARAAKVLGHPLEARVRVTVQSGGTYDAVLRRFEAALPELFVVSAVVVQRADALLGVDGPAGVSVERIEGIRCGRCWTYAPEVGSRALTPDLCDRCAGVLQAVTS
jgi:isoleucyl-tRNA synthetase